MRLTRVHALGLVAVLALAGAGAAFALSRTSEHGAGEKGSDRPGRTSQHHHHRGAARLAVRESFAAAADYIGVSRSELVSRLRAGESLAQIAEAEGKSVDGLKQAILDAIIARLDVAVDDLVHRARAPRTP